MAEKQRTGCTLAGDMEIVRADVGAWRALARYHYRSGHCGAADRVFAIRRKASDRPGAMWPRWHKREAPIGVIVYGMPTAESAMRKAATNGRYVGVGDNAARLGLVNRELRTITRVVIDPRFRGIGLGRRLVAETLPLAGTPLVEALAAMGAVNPFFERAGMTRYEGRLSATSERMLAALEAVGIEQNMISDLGLLIGRLDAKERRWIVYAMDVFCQSHGQAGRKIARRAAESGEIGEMVRLVRRQVMLRPVYYLWGHV
jgi:GNAT superfamily N-acetyltransferase